MAASSAHIVHSPAFVLSLMPVTHAQQLVKCAHLNFRHAIPLLSFVVHALQSVKCTHLNLGRIWQITKCAHLNLRHTIPLLSFVVCALQFVKCAHLNSWCAIHW